MNAKNPSRDLLARRYLTAHRIAYTIVWCLSWVHLFWYLLKFHGESENEVGTGGIRSNFIDREMMGFEMGARKGMLDGGATSRDIDWAVAQTKK